MRVEGKRLAYGYYSGWTVGKDNEKCQETSGVHEFAELCRLMLKFIQKEDLGFRAAYVPKSSCAYMNATRKLLKKHGEAVYAWKDFKPGWGWTETIQCMTDVVSGLR